MRMQVSLDHFIKVEINQHHIATYVNLFKLVRSWLAEVDNMVMLEGPLVADHWHQSNPVIFPSWRRWQSSVSPSSTAPLAAFGHKLGPRVQCELWCQTARIRTHSVPSACCDWGAVIQVLSPSLRSPWFWPRVWSSYGYSQWGAESCLTVSM